MIDLVVDCNREAAGRKAVGLRDLMYSTGSWSQKTVFVRRLIFILLQIGITQTSVGISE